MRIALPLALPVALLAAPAAAEPGFLTMDRQDGQSRVGGELSYLLLDDSLNDVTAFRFELHGQYVLPSGFGFYGAFPISYVSGNGDSATGIGDIELGGIFLPRMANPAFSLPIHGGITVPTGSDDFDSFLANAIGASARITDLVLLIPQGFTLRLGASPTYRTGQFFGRLDGGVDINLSQSGDGTTDPVIRLNIGGGIDLGNVAITGELVNVFSTNSDAQDQSATALAIGVRGVAGSLRPYGGIALPLDNDFAADAVFTAGLEAVLR